MLAAPFLNQADSCPRDILRQTCLIWTKWDNHFGKDDAHGTQGFQELQHHTWYSPEQAAIYDILYGYVALLLSNNSDFPGRLSLLINIHHAAIS